MKLMLGRVLVYSSLVAMLSAAPAGAASGVWERAWGKDVDNAAGSGPEICVVAANCQTGLNTTAAGGEFNQPNGVATDAAGNVYIADTDNNRVQKFDANGNFLRMWGKDVTAAGPNQTGTGFEICVAAQADTCKVGVSGGLGGEMNSPNRVAVDSQGNVYVSDRLNQRIQKFNSAGTFFLAWGKDVVSAGPDQTGTGFEICDASLDTCKEGGFGGNPGGELFLPQGVATDAGGNVYVADNFNDRVQKFNANGNFLRLWGTDVVASGPENLGTGFEVCTIAANCKFAGSGAGAGGDVHNPGAIAVDRDGNVYVGQSGLDRRVQKFTSSGNFLRLWGKDVVSAGPGNTGTGSEICVAGVDTCKIGELGAAGGEFDSLVGIATDATGAVYISDSSDRRIQSFDANGSFIRAWGRNVVSAGPGDTGAGFEICVAGVDSCQAGSSGSPSLGGEMRAPAGLATDPSGDLYVTDSTDQRVQKFAADPSPETTIAAGPGVFATSSPTFTLVSSDPGSTFECRLDGGAFAACATPFTAPSLADGDHELQARAIDPARQVDGTPASRAFTVDTTAPDTQVDSGPPDATNDTTPTFAFSSSEPDSTFECRVDEGAFASCTAPHTTEALADGQHTFEVRATDAVGHVDSSPAGRHFTVDADPPETTITKEPKAKLKQGKSATYEFSADEPGSFLCSIDDKSRAPCDSPLKLTKLKKGKHSFEVAAVDPAGNADPTPATDSFKVKKPKHRHG